MASTPKAETLIAKARQHFTKSESSDDLDLHVEKVKLRNFKTSFVRVAQNLNKTVQTIKQKVEKQVV